MLGFWSVEKQIPFGNDRKKSKDEEEGQRQILFGNDRQEKKRLRHPLTRCPGSRAGLDDSELLNGWPYYDLIDLYIGRLLDCIGNSASDGFRRNGNLVKLFEIL